MRKYLILLLFVLAACAEQPDLESIKQSFIDKKVIYKQLRAMIKEDQRKNSCFSVGFKKLGYYQHKYKGYWELALDISGKSKNFLETMTFTEVLDFEKITQKRYEKYLSLLKKINARDISYCTSLDKTNWTSLTVYSSAKITRYTSVAVEIKDNLSIPASIKNNYKIIPLNDSWYIFIWQ